MQSSPEVWKDFFETYYRDELNKAAEKTISLNGSSPINVNYLKDLVIFKEGIVAEELLDYPDMVLDHANHGIAQSENIHNVKLENSRASVYNLPISRRVLIRDLRSEHISKLVSIDGVVRKVTEVRPRVVEAAFVCSSCAVKMFIHQEDSTIKYPYECKSCGSRKFIFLPEESRSIDSQRMRIQEYPENLRGGEQPQTLDVVLENDLTGIINPGDRVVINGIVRATPRSLSGKRLRHMDITLEGNSIEVLQQEYEEFEITEEDKKKILEIGNDPEIFEKIVKSIAPVIYGYEDMKMSVALQLFGGIPKKLPDGTEIRGDVHVLFVGDPGVAKSQLLRYVHRIAPRSVYTTGKGTTSAGLCVAPESLIFGENNAYQIGELVESSDLTEYENGVYRSKLDEPIKVQTINPAKTSFKPSNTLWKIRSPEKLIKVRSQTGKEVVATPNTKILVMENGEVKWKKSGEIHESDFIATARRLDHKGEKVLTLELVKDLDITVYGVEKLVKDLVAAIKSKKGLTTRELANEVGVNENNLYHSWVKESAVGSIDLKTLIRLAEEAEYTLEDIAQKIESFSQFHGHKIKLPPYLDERFLYFAGLIAGDGDISRSPTGGYTVRFSNGDARLRRDFMELTEELFGIKTTEGSDGVRIPSIRFGSKIVATILKRLGIPESPKSHKLDMSETLLSLPHKELAAYIRGLFDCDGSIMVRKNGSSCIEFDTTIKNLAEKLHLSLLRFGITSYMRERKYKGEVTELEIDDNARKITRKHNGYELKLYGKNIERFNEKIGVGHSAKSEKLSKLLTEIGVRDTDSTIANLGGLLKEIRTFYGLSIKEVYGSNIGQLIEKDKRQTSTTVLKNAVETLSTANLAEVKIGVTEELRLRSGELVVPEELELSRERFYECFKRTNRSIRIPAGLLLKAKEKIKDRDGHVHNELSNLLDNLVYQEELIQEKLEYLKQLAYSDIVWERVKEKQEIKSPYEYVYDLTVDGSHSFLANGIVVHNTAAATKDEYDGRWTLEAGALVLADKGIALVDEIDKMKADDRGGLHEAMEQQSYHPSFEITLSDGSKHKIGQLVDDLFEEYPERRVEGIDCEILDANGLDIDLLTTDFKKTFKTKADRVSRHKAPDYFVKIKYFNGREVIVTPEHPVYIFRNGEIVTEEASQINSDEFIPSVKDLELSGVTDLQTEVPLGRKTVEIPSQMNEELASFLGYFTTEGYSYAGSAMEVGLSNTDDEVISDMSGAICSSFGVRPINYTSVNRTLRVVSKPVYEFMSANFPQLMVKSKQKRLPPQIFSASFEERVSFLRSAFVGDGSTETEALCYRTSSKGLAEDYQDLLLTVGVYSRIVLDKSSNSYKVYITGCSLERFVETILGENSEKTDFLLKRSDKNLRKHDVLPPYSGEILRECLGELGLKYDGYFNQHINRNYGITREVISRYVKIIEERIEELENTHAESFKEFREFLNYSQEKTAELIGTTRSAVNYLERGGYSSDKRAMMFEKLKNGSEEIIQNVKEKLTKVKELEESRWLKIKEVEYISNEGEYRTDWVYDVTVEPTHNFISHGIILHNTVSVAKAGINAVLWARCAMLGAANPKYGRFDRYAPIAEQIDLSPTLLSRFDLIFVMTDDPDENRDRALAKHILDSHELGEKLEKLKNIVSTEYDQNAVMSEAKKIEPVIDPELLRKYIAYAKRTVFPVLTREVKQTIEDFYSSLRSQAKENTPMPVTARQLEALIRLAEASARLQLKDKITIEDVNRVISIVKKSLEQIAVDPETGEMDIDYAFSGTSKTQRDRIMVIKKIVEGIAAVHEKGAPEDEVLNSAEEQGISWNKAKEILQKMRMNGEVYCPKPGYFDITHNY